MGPVAFLIASALPYAVTVVSTCSEGNEISASAIGMTLRNIALHCVTWTARGYLPYRYAAATNTHDTPAAAAFIFRQVSKCT